ncbi:hypothetical protein DICVIV_05090 [Dictyocaulus viviparus]|uniref:Uncharacterized protein n=1 Tax=Dictyocaulus viviparus TaxID=29172 RepID=A0A0D8XWA0_DICVI|nr:hypothetical protein DICVIV_05090 [Dictyocaulus viviparus]
MSDKLKTEQSSAVENHPKGSRSVMEQYCEELRKWVVEVHCWQAFHQYNVAVAAYQSWQQSLSVDVLRQRRHENTTEAVDTNNAADANNFGNADGQLERLVFPVPTSAREVAVIRNPDGSDVLAAQFVYDLFHSEKVKFHS